MDCAFVENVDIERLDTSRMVYHGSAGEGAHDLVRIVNFKDTMHTVLTRCVLMPSYGTMQAIVNNHPRVFEVHKNKPAPEGFRGSQGSRCRKTASTIASAPIMLGVAFSTFWCVCSQRTSSLRRRSRTHSSSWAPAPKTGIGTTLTAARSYGSISPQGTISLLTDTVRKYNDDYKYNQQQSPPRCARGC